MGAFDPRYNVQAIFNSLDGEVNGYYGAGQLASFIRLKGCNLSCEYCDTSYAQKSKPENWMTVDEILAKVNLPKVTITGGEPLLQLNEDFSLIDTLIFNGYDISVETNGSVKPLPGFFAYSECLRLICDYKLPSSGEEDKMNMVLFQNLRRMDIIKFVVSNEGEYRYVCKIIEDHSSWIARKVFSPIITYRTSFDCDRCEDVLEIEREWPQKLAELMIRDKVDAQFSLQMHKILWPGSTEER